MKYSLLTLALVLFSSFASAGTLRVQDEKNWIPSGDLATLEATAKDSPFDVRVLIGERENLSVLEDAAHNMVDRPTTMVVAVDPTHRRTVTRFGNQTNVKPGDYDSISQAGNAHFRAKESAKGLSAIIVRAKASASAPQAISASTTPVVVEGGLSSGTYFLIFLLVGCFLGVAFYVWRRSKRDREDYEETLNEVKEEAAELRSRNIVEMTRPEPEVIPAPVVNATIRKTRPAPSMGEYGARGPAAKILERETKTVVVNNNNDSGSNLLTGYLLGSEIERLANDRYKPSDYSIPNWDRSSPSRTSSSDSGGSSSSYDYGSSSSSSSDSSYDSSGSSSSWDSGSSSSSFDFGGGGGFDSGGGSSSW